MFKLHAHLPHTYIKTSLMIKGILFILFSFVNTALLFSQNAKEKLLFGVAYYDEYMPYERLEKDIAMMKEAGINVIRIAESTWSTVEPQDNIFDFKHIDRVLNAMYEANIKVIIGTPTYAVPTWLVKSILQFWQQHPRGDGSMAQGRTWISQIHISFFMLNG